jgi:hypothetical protein
MIMSEVKVGQAVKIAGPGQPHGIIVGFSQMWERRILRKQPDDVLSPNVAIATDAGFFWCNVSRLTKIKAVYLDGNATPPNPMPMGLVDPSKGA